MKSIGGVVAGTFGVLLSASAHAVVIDTASAWNGTTHTCCFGDGNGITLGQTFYVPETDTILDSFSFWIDDMHPPTDSVDFAAYVMEWRDSVGSEPAHATGSVLYQSPQQITTNNNGIGGMEKFVFETGGLALEANKKYVAFLSSSLFWDGNSSSGSVGAVTCCGGDDSSGDVIGGEYVVIGNGRDFLPYLTLAGWNFYRYNDLAFRGEFSAPVPVPEPSTLLLLASGLVGLGVTWRRRVVARAALLASHAPPPTESQTVRPNRLRRLGYSLQKA